MARHNTSGNGYTFYAPFIKRVTADLKLELFPIQWRFIDRKTYSGRAITYTAHAHIYISVRYGDALHTIAHELRHVWQTVQGHLTYDDTRGVILWRGNEHCDYATERQYFNKSDEYYYLPWEKDANIYADIMSASEFYNYGTYLTTAEGIYL